MLLRACGRAAAAGPPPAACACARATQAAAPAQQHAAAARPCARVHARRRRRFASAAAAAAEAAAAAPPAGGAPHVPVLLDEVLAAFEGLAVRRYVDGTLGAAGHAAAMLRRHPEMRALVGFDLDPTAHQLASARLAAAGASVVPVAVSPAGRPSVEPPGGGGGGTPTAFLVRSNFGRMKAVVQQLPLGEAGGAGGSACGAEAGQVDAILLDLGISSMQVDTPERGFSFLRDGPLDMRMDPGAALSAEAAVNEWPEAELGRVIRELGEERHWRGIARRIVEARERAPITTTQQLVAAIGGGRPRGGRGAPGGRAKHPATRTFQALRIAVNGELQSVAQVLPDAVQLLAPGGRLAVITFHSLEDRLVKWAFRAAAGMAPSDEALPSYCLPFEQTAAQPAVRILTRRPVAPSDAEQAANARSRSAKLRVVEKL